MNGVLPTRFILSDGQVITPDTCIAQTHQEQAAATMHPVADGSSIADHVIRQPASISLTTIWTPRPDDDAYEPRGTGRPQEAFDILVAAIKKRQPIQIEVDNITYDPVVLTSVSMPRAFADGDGRTIEVEAQEIQIVRGQTVKIKVAPALQSKGKKSRKKVEATKSTGDTGTFDFRDYILKSDLSNISLVWGFKF